MVIGESPYILFTASTDNRIRQQIRNRDTINVGIANQGEVWLNDLKSPTPLNLIPYKGLAPMLNDVIPGHTEYGVLAHTGIAPYVKDNQVRPMLVFADQRLPQLPAVPTAGELGFTGAYTNNWYAIWARQDTGQEAVMTMSRLVQGTVNLEFRDLPGLTVLNHGPKKAIEYANREIRIFERIADKSKR
jgi:hypothetical protein